MAICQRYNFIKETDTSLLLTQNKKVIPGGKIIFKILFAIIVHFGKVKKRYFIQ